MAARESVEGQNGAGLTTFGGVFTPSILTILGLVLFLRLGFVTGSVGLGQMLLILGLSTAVSVLTTISLAALATNLKVGGGGVYFLISRTLGPAFGGAIGLVLYLAMSISVAFYAIGLGEAVASVVGNSDPLYPRLVAAAAIVLLLLVAWAGADIATKAQYVVMACLAVAIVGYFVGVVGRLDPSLLVDNVGRPSRGISFWAGFALFFPAITGFTQGVAMSGDLKTPSRSISVGTFGAIGLSTVVYATVIVTLSMSVPLGQMRNDTAIMRDLSLTYWLVDVGVIAATLSSAIASLVGAPRVLQRLAADRLIEPLEPFAHGSGRDENPRRGVLLTSAIAFATVALGDLDMVAPIISMFFLASYGMINYATYSEARAASTSFRPRFRFFDWRLSLLGTMLCLLAVVAVDPISGVMAGAALFWLYRYLSRSPKQARWADSTRGFHASSMRTNLQSFSLQTDTTRDWRPVTVAFAPRDPVRRHRLRGVAHWFEGGAGFTTIVRIVTGGGPMARKIAGRIDLELQSELGEGDDVVYGRVIAADTLEGGVSAMLQAHGIGALRPNLVLTSWFDEAWSPEKASGHGSMIQTAVRHGCNVGVVYTPDLGWARIHHAAGQSQPRIIRVWWSDDHTGQLLTMLAWMCTRESVLKGATIEVLVEAGTSADVNRVRAVVDDARLPAEVVGTAEATDFNRLNRRADMVLAPARVRHGQILGPGAEPLEQLVDGLGVAVFAHAPSPFELDVQPDETDLAAVADAEERAVALSSRADDLSQVAATLLVSAELLRIEQQEGRSVSADVLVDAEQQARQAQRVYVDARTRADEAWRLVRELDPGAATEDLKPQDWIGIRRRNGKVTPL